MKKIPVVMDVDTGTDDAIAIICALMSRDQLDIKAITRRGGECLPVRHRLQHPEHCGPAGAHRYPRGQGGGPGP